MDKEKYVVFNTETEELEYFCCLLDIQDKYPRALYDHEEVIKRYKNREITRQNDMRNHYNF